MNYKDFNFCLRVICQALIFREPTTDKIDQFNVNSIVQYV